MSPDEVTQACNEMKRWTLNVNNEIASCSRVKDLVKHETPEHLDGISHASSDGDDCLSAQVLLLRDHADIQVNAAKRRCSALCQVPVHSMKTLITGNRLVAC